jgi:Tfp pilus assembly protein FimV
MCGGSPRAPRVVYQGPSDADIQRNEASLAQYQQQMTDQQDTFQAQLQQQIADANAETEALQSEYAAEASAVAAAAASAAQTASYATTAQETEMAPDSQTTSAIAAKKKPKKNLKISTAGTVASAGSGLNIGV